MFQQTQQVNFEQTSSLLDPILPINVIGLSREQIKDVLLLCGVPSSHMGMRVQQLWHWIYHRGVVDFDVMLNIAKPLRENLKKYCTLIHPHIVREQLSRDGTRKWLIALAPEREGAKPCEIECVYIPEEDRGTLCVSSQVGCTLTCTFCHTGTQKLVRNLTSQEIIQQVMVARHRLGDFPHGVKPDDGGMVPQGDGIRAVSNIVFMGMGEPLYNFENICVALDILSDGEGLSLSRRRITVSTAGVVPKIVPLGERAGAMLAISLHAVRDDVRDRLVPLNKKYPIQELLQACRSYPGLSNARRITFEYVMLKGINDTKADARELIRLLQHIPAKINLIPFNPWPGTSFECSSSDVIDRFSQMIFDAGYASPVRTPRGRDILAACGQLKSDTEKLRARARLVMMDEIPHKEIGG